MTVIKTQLRRRHLLAGLGAGALALPWLSRIPSAEAATYPTRFVVFFSPNEPIERKYWRPSNNMQLTEVMQPLQPHVEKLVLLGNMRMRSRDEETHGGGHIGTGHILTGRTVSPYGSKNAEYWASGQSLDQFIADRLGVTALTLAARPGGANGNDRISYRGDSQPVHPIEDPRKAFDQVLGDFALPPDERKERDARRSRVIDAVAGRFGRLRSRLGQADREKLELHLQQIDELDGSLGGGTLECDPTAPAGGFDYRSNADYPVTARRHIDVLVQALACDVTRVATLQHGNSGATHLTPRWPDFGIDINKDEHNIAHAYNVTPTATEVSQREQLETFYYRQFAYLLDRLDSVPEGNGTLLDNTVVLWGKPIGRNHSANQMLFMLVGGAGGALQGRRYIDANDVAHNDLLVSCAQLMGLDDVTSFGDARFCTGPMSL